ncbi:MAG: hypothetical protein KBT03_02210 [Bacteroidales bacterium]|nr:hypothetical protein [Candidatus Scybalousia scybalohippi]
MADKVKFGLQDVHISARTVSEQGDVTYATPVAWEGAVALTLSKTKNKATFRADNRNFVTRFIAAAREGTLEMANIPDWFKTAYLGYKLDSNGKLVETDAQGGEFAILYRVETDTDHKMYCIYNVIAAESNEEHRTTEENDLGIQTSTLDLSMTGEVVDGYACYCVEVDSLTTAPEVPTFPASN